MIDDAQPLPPPLPPDEESLRVGVIGAGRVGASVAAALAGVGVCVTGLAAAPGRRTRHVAQVAERLGMPHLPLQALLREVDLVLLTVPDDALARTAGALAQLLPPHPPQVVHCSGAHDLACLEPLHEAGVQVGAWHPLQAFPTDTTPVGPGITWAVTAPDPLAARLHALSACLHGRPHDLRGADRPRYHAAAVLAANSAVTLLDHAVGLLVELGLPQEDATRSVTSLLRTALDGVDAHGLPDALTGPAVRGDVDTVTAHLNALAGHTDADALYRATGLATLPLLNRRGVDPATVERLRALLDDPDTGPRG